MTNFHSELYILSLRLTILTLSQVYFYRHTRIVRPTVLHRFTTKY
jgi:hypothetical protein